MEAIGIFTNQALKAGRGEEDFKRFFVLVSSLFAISEGTPQVPNAEDDKNELIAQIKEIDNKRHLLEMLRAIRLVVDEGDKPESKGYYILQLNYSNHRLSIHQFKPKIISGNIVSKNHEIYDMLIDSFGLNKELLISKADDAKKLLSNDLLDSIIKSIPQEWVEHEGRENVGLLFEQVCLRRDNMRAICEQIVLERNR